MVLNEFRKSKGFYELYKVEAMIRNFARKFQNSFHLAFYACCRETFDPERHCGGYNGTNDEVAKYLEEQDVIKKAAMQSLESQNVVKD